MKTLFAKPGGRNTWFCPLLVMALLCLMSLAIPAVAQKRNCGTVLSPEVIEWDRARISTGKLSYPALAVTLPYHIPVTVHIVRQSNGTGGLRLGQLDTAMQDINSKFSPDMQFFQYGSIDYINSDLFYNCPDSQQVRDSLAQTNRVASTLNAYFTNLVNLCGQNTSGVSSNISVLVDIACGTPDRPASFAHEVGHQFSLRHTFDTSSGIECPSGSNCATAGDLVCDTPADPLCGTDTNYCTTCTVDSNCVFSGACPAPAGCDATPYAPPTTNIMHYYSKECRLVFTAGQRSRMDSYLEASRTTYFVKTKYVDATYVGTEEGTPSRPYNTVTEAVNAAGAGDYIFIRSGDYPLDTPTITKRVYMEKWNTGGSPVVIGGT
ncbi:MAG: M43 family zinc metalloprotease [Limisphaerales bacterium]